MSAASSPMAAVVGALLAIFCVGPPAKAQSAEALGIQQAAAVARAEQLGNGPSDSSVETPRALVELTAGRSGSAAVLRYGRTLSRFGSHDDRRGTLGWYALAATFSTPFGSSAGGAELATLDGLSDARTVGLKLTRAVQHVGLKPDAALSALCSRLQAEAKAEGQALETCSTSAIHATLGPARAIEWDAALFAGPTWTQGIEIEAGRKSYAWLAEDLATRLRSHETPWAASLFIGVQWPRNVLLTSGWRHESTFREGSKKSLCKPAAARPELLECESKTVGAPRASHDDQAFVALRGRTARLGFEARVEHDFDDSDTAVSLPIYFLRNAGGGLTGGLRFDWTERSGDVTAAVFIGSELDIGE